MTIALSRAACLRVAVYANTIFNCFSFSVIACFITVLHNVTLLLQKRYILRLSFPTSFGDLMDLQ
jgi:hypothetical protein